MIVKNILLTGASSGIGEALALYYAKQPETENIFICGRNQQRLQAVKEVCEKAGTAKNPRPDIGRYQPPCYGKMDKRS